MKKIILITGIIAVLILLILFPGKKLAREHVNSKTAVSDHPLLCTNCHVYISKSSLISGLVNKDYYSPMNMAVSEDGKRLYVTAQDGDELIAIDTGSGKTIKKIPVGHKPHSVILGKSGKTAWVSNQWSDNVSVVDLERFEVTDTLATGNGPAGLSFDSEEKNLYVVNSYSSDLSVIDLKTGIEIKRLPTGNNPTGAQLSPDGNSLFVTARRAIIVPYGEPVTT